MIAVRMIAAQRMTAWFLLVSLLNAPAIGAESSTGEAYSPDDLAFFENKIRPVLVEHCYSCHSTASESIKAGLRVDSRRQMLVGGDSGPAIEPGDVDASLLIGAIRYEDYEMPPSGKLSDEVLANFAAWIERNAPWPDEPEPTAGQSVVKEFNLQQRKSEHWAWQPMSSVSPPQLTPVRDSINEPLTDIDLFLLDRLDKEELVPAPSVDRLALARRIAFDLVGLPPTPSQLAELERDTNEDSIERYVDRLLESPQFGERWGRHWLDLVRYAESRGHEFDADIPAAYQYRDYVIRALNADVSYDQFVREHIAGDRLPQPRLNPEHGYNESILGTGFWFLGEWVHSPVDIRKDESDRFDNMIDCFSKAFLSITVACARCHDHKFDAISTEDYYALSGYLQGSQFRRVQFETLQANHDVAQSLATIDTEFQSRLHAELDRLVQLDPIKATPDWMHTPCVPPTTAHVLVDYSHACKSKPHDAGDTHYLADGPGFGNKPTAAGEWIVERIDGADTVSLAAFGSARNDPFWDGLEVQADRDVNSDRTSLPSGTGRALRTGTIELRHPIVSILVRGAGHVFACVDSHRLVAGPLHGETQFVVKPGEDQSLRWVDMNLGRYVGHRLHFEFTPNANSTFEVLRVMQGDSALATVDKNFADSIAAAQQWLPQLLERVGDDASRPLREIQAEWIAARDALRSQVKPRSRLAMAMMDGVGEDDALLIRGNASTPGRIVQRHFLTAIDPTPLREPQSSGRLELADAVTARSNPLYARSIVNRVWHHLFGRGIVPTVDDFGVLGQRPTHPELLDYLAQWFLDDGQSIKRLIRKIVLTRAYRMSGETTPVAIQRDPDNLLYHHRPPQRLEAEIIRDSLLFVSGELNSTMYGESIPVHLTAFMQGRGRPATSGPADGDRRRSIYLGLRRNFISPFMLAFDTPVPFSTMGRRTVSNVPAQALILMNDPFVAEQAQSWARQLIRHEPDDIDRRIVWLYQSAYARYPSTAEASAIEAFLHGGSDNELDRWTTITHAVINSKEFIFVP